MPTEKECKIALEILKARVNYENVDAIICFKELIDEHFDNPPLEWEEIKPKMWVWSKSMKSWIYIFKPHDWKPIKGIRYSHRLIYHSADGYYMDYKRNEFYRKEVQE